MPHNQRHGYGTVLAQPEILEFQGRLVCGIRIPGLWARTPIQDEQLPTPEKKKRLLTLRIGTFRDHVASVIFKALGFAVCGGVRIFPAQ